MCGQESVDARPGGIPGVCTRRLGQIQDGELTSCSCRVIGGGGGVERGCHDEAEHQN